MSRVKPVTFVLPSAYGTVKEQLVLTRGACAALDFCIAAMLRAVIGACE